MVWHSGVGRQPLPQGAETAYILLVEATTEQEVEIEEAPGCECLFLAAHLAVLGDTFSTTGFAPQVLNDQLSHCYGYSVTIQGGWQIKGQRGFVAGWMGKFWIFQKVNSAILTFIIGKTRQGLSIHAGGSPVRAAILLVLNG